MKKLNTLIAILVLTTTIANAKIWRVNNNSGITADFTTAQAAHNAATAGDTIHLEPSGTNYGDLTLSKRLVVISTGMFITQNPGYQVQSNTGRVNYLTINNTGANGSVVMVGFDLDLNINSGVGNILVQNCATTYNGGGYNCCGHYGNININNADNIIIQGCFINNINARNGSNNIIVKNNILVNSFTNDAGCDGVLANNIISAFFQYWNYGGGHGYIGGNIYNCTVENNIWVKGHSQSFSACLVRNNLSASTGSLPSGNGNQEGVDMTTVLVNKDCGFVDNGYQLKAGSVAIGAGYGGSDCGAFAGANPFRLAVTPAIPSIYKLEVPSTPAGNTMNIKFSTRSNN
jgi:hypothetical protein